MILIGQYDSPFVRRVAIALRLYGIDFEHRPWSVFGDATAVSGFNPLIRVPTLVLGDNEVLIESSAILDYVDETADPGMRLIADRGPDRRATLKACALATGLADKAVSLVYERVLHKEQSEVWFERCMAQISGVLTALEASRKRSRHRFWFGPTINHADIALACALRFTREAHPGVFDERRWPMLSAHSELCEALQPFRDIVQPVSPP
jgi:glutathione S-transferase